MGKTLVLAEKPSVGRELARVLGCTRGRDGYLEGSGHIVTWALGHLVELADPEHYGKQYEKWSLDTLPMLPKQMDLAVIKGTGRQFNVVKQLLNNPEVSQLVIATDAGREGELVARWIVKKAGFHKPMKRLWISSQTDKAIREGFSKLKDAKEYDNLYASAQCRAEADWLVGLNVTRALTCKFSAQLSAGRVQTPTLAMIVQREEEIRRFVPKSFYGLTADFQGFSGVYRNREGQSRLFSKEQAEELKKQAEGQNAQSEGQKGKSSDGRSVVSGRNNIVSDGNRIASGGNGIVAGSSGVVAELSRDKKREAPPLLYDLTELQRDANSRFGFSAKKTLDLMQKLYEEHKVLTYPRTDSRHLSADIIPSLRERVKVCAADSDFAPLTHKIMAKGISVTKRIVDDTKVTDHHAIIPTEEFPRFSAFSGDERKIYDLVVRRFLAVFLEDFQYEQTTVALNLSGLTFYARGRIVKEQGWKSAYGQGDAQGLDSDGEDASEGSGGDGDVPLKSQRLPDLKKGQSIPVQRITLTSGQTSPPARYTEGTLLSAMEHPGKFIDNRTLRSVVDSVGGIGTPATRADIIEKLFASSYIERKGNHIVPLSKGMQLVKLVPEELKSPELTAKWEQRLTAISKGAEKKEAFLAEMRSFSAHLVGRVIASDANYRHDNLTRTKCPDCGKFLLEVNGKKGKMLVCQDRECGYRRNLSYVSNARCPNCHKKLTVSGDGEKRLYTCVCGFREKFDRFNKQLQEKHNQGGKQELEAYRRKQKEEESQQESAFAIAWAKRKAAERDKKE